VDAYQGAAEVRRVLGFVITPATVAATIGLLNRSAVAVLAEDFHAAGWACSRQEGGLATEPILPGRGWGAAAVAALSAQKPAR
jgi:hypothetical protein